MMYGTPTESKDGAPLFIRVPFRLRRQLQKWIDQRRLSSIVVPFLERLVAGAAATSALELTIANKERQVAQLLSEIEADKALLREIQASADAARAHVAEVDTWLARARDMQRRVPDRFDLEDLLRRSRLDEDQRRRARELWAEATPRRRISIIHPRQDS